MSEHVLTQELEANKIVVVLGPGGVGKTTTSIALAVLAAKNGMKVGLLSIDPAKRLAAALGMSLSDHLSEINLGEGIELKGSIEAAMLDQKAVFDAMVKKYTPNEKTAKKILNHKLYKASSSKLAGPLEYMALAKLQDMVENGNYDLVVLDTPPDTHALDFLKRPNMLAGFLEHRVMTWLIKPFHLASRFGGAKIFSAGEKLMGGIAKVTGFKALSMLAEFLVLIQDVITGFHESGEKIVELLSSKDTSFILVSTPTPAAARSSKNLMKQVYELGYVLDGVLLNRCLPAEVAKNIEDYSSKNQKENLKLLENISKREKGEKAILKDIVDTARQISSNKIFNLHIEEQENELHTGQEIYNFASIIGGL